jgi:hypothetical protein
MEEAPRASRDREGRIVSLRIITPEEETSTEYQRRKEYENRHYPPTPRTKWGRWSELTLWNPLGEEDRNWVIPLGVGLLAGVAAIFLVGSPV